MFSILQREMRRHLWFRHVAYCRLWLHKVLMYPNRPCVFCLNKLQGQTLICQLVQMGNTSLGLRSLGTVLRAALMPLTGGMQPVKGCMFDTPDIETPGDGIGQ